MISDELLGACEISLLLYFNGIPQRMNVPLRHDKTAASAGELDLEITLVL